MPRKKTPVNIFIVSDATGATAKSVLTSVLVQYRDAQFNVKSFPFTREVKQVEDIVAQAPPGKCIIVFTLVSPKLRDVLIQRSSEKKLTIVDVIGPLIKNISGVLKHTPKMTPGAPKPADDEMSRLSLPIHYTLTHDDGLGLETLDQADLIILGVSRTGKTPTSIYLSCRNLKVANIPIVLDQPLPAELANVKAKKVGFTIELERLAQLRAERTRRMIRARPPGYANPPSIMRELVYCEELFRRIPMLHTIDVTNRSIEETSEWIARHVL